MPFKTEKEVAEKIKGADKLSARKRRQFLHVFNSCFEENGDDASCYAKAWGAVQKTASLKIAKEILAIARELAHANK